MKQFSIDLGVFYKHDLKTLLRVCSTNIDDILHAGNEDYWSMSEETKKRFYCKQIIGTTFIVLDFK